MDQFKEFEIRFIHLDRKQILQKLEKIKAEKTGDFFFKEWIFQYDDWREQQRRIRVRTDGKTTWLAYKARETGELGTTQEIEFIVASAGLAVEFLKASGVPFIRYQEKKRVRYEREGIIFELDAWPKIPFVLEIESTSPEKVKEGAQLIGLSWEDAKFENQKIIHKKYFNVDLDQITEYRFEE